MSSENIEKSDRGLPILLIDDEIQTLRSYEMLLLAASYENFISCASAEEGFRALEKQDVSMIILDLAMPGMGGMKMLKKLSRDFPQIPVVVVTAYQEVETAVECMKNGAFDFLVKPVEKLRMLNVIKHAVEIRNLRNENVMLQNSIVNNKLKHPETFRKIITASPQMNSVFLYIQSIAITSQPVLISGETGVGKELIAEAIHLSSKRSGKLVTLNVAGLDDATFSDTLFGHKPGAYTDARQKRSGLIETAKDGTIFLDEIGDLKENSQVKLLRLIQEKEYYPLGADVPSKSNARIVTATNHDLKKLIKTGSFRRDLYYRLNLHYIHVPPLRERPDDIEPLAEKFINEACRELERKRPQIDPEFYELLRQYSFPGNIRELQTVIYESLSRSDSDKITLNYVKNLLSCGTDTTPIPIIKPAQSPSREIQLTTLEETESIMIDKALDASDGNLSKAARSLGVSRSTLYRKLNKKQ